MDLLLYNNSILAIVLLPERISKLFVVSIPQSAG